MRALYMVLMIAGMISTVDVYAVGLGSTPTKTLAGSGYKSVSAPNTGWVTLGYVTADKVVTRTKVTWFPASAGNYDITVKAGCTTGTPNISSCGTAARTDTVTISSTETNAMFTAKVVIFQS